ncbi:hypothetical protein SAMN04488074_101305 [Lentzea albidocapillata subsp. violacea]|uniref:Lipoprotein n=1 Tax=Lentzea albidocapillata subsp. violacea TaxID=128104 RepID=A0A1G8QCB6_9PSEU|nr:hypothetical protein [Lentzea albidocapillata]SDJ02449.1 hypothetical protein SAMN04488074_101305 [Lentzea albidocapillata subsp. violacea]
MRQLALALCVLAAACSAEQPPPPLSPGLEPPQPYDIVLGRQIGLIDHTQQKIRNRCLADAGYPQDASVMLAQPVDSFEFLTMSERDFGPTSEDEARRLGFGQDTIAAPGRVASFDANYDRNLERCSEQAWAKLGPDAHKTFTDYYELVNTLADYHRDVDAAMPPDMPAKVLDCMAGKGFTVPVREEFLKKPAHQQFGVTYGKLDGGAEDAWVPRGVPGTVEIGPALPVRHYTPTPEESSVALAWFRCGRETGRMQAWFAAVQQVQARNVEKHQTWIDELNPKVEELARKAAAVAGES